MSTSPEPSTVKLRPADDGDAVVDGIGAAVAPPGSDVEGAPAVVAGASVVPRALDPGTDGGDAASFGGAPHPATSADHAASAATTSPARPVDRGVLTPAM